MQLTGALVKVQRQPIAAFFNHYLFDHQVEHGML